MERLEQLQAWLQQILPGETYPLAPASSDASFRRYFRIKLPERSLIIMDAPPQQENCVSFVHVARLFKAAGVHVPEIVAQDLAQGFLLLSDLGTETYLSQLNAPRADDLYRDANNALIKIHLASQPDQLPAYDAPRLLHEMHLFPEWYIAKHLQVQLSAKQTAVLESALQLLLHNVLAQPSVYVHRDFHSRNLMCSEPNPGVLDFQDAVLGPITYDLVSLYKDAYVGWDEARVIDWTIRYWEAAKRAQLPVADDFGAFYRDFEWMGIQRHLKVLGIFARLYYRDGKAGYLNDMPLVLDYLRKACERYRAFGPFLELLDEVHKCEHSVGYTF